MYVTINYVKHIQKARYIGDQLLSSKALIITIYYSQCTLTHQIQQTSHSVSRTK